MTLTSKLTQTQFGAIVGISQPTVSDLLKRGVLTPGSTGQQWITEYCAHLREIAAGRASDGDHDLVAERARLAHHQANIAELQEAATRKTLIPADQVRAKWQDMTAAARARLLALPTRIASSCAGKEPADIEREARALVYQALEELARGDGT